MAKKTNLLVYVDKDVMSDPAQLFDAAITHMIRKDVDIAKRRQFIVEYQRAVRQAKDPIAVIHEWMQVRDVAGFPFRNKAEVTEKDALNELASGGPGIRGAKAGAKLRKDVLDASVPGKAGIRGAKFGTVVFYDERDADESEGTEGGVSVDDGADGQEVNGQTPRDGADQGDGSGDTGDKRKRNKR